MARLRTPGCTTAVRAYGSTRTMRFSRAVEMTTPSCIGSAPPDRPVPAPRGTIGTFSSRQMFEDRQHLLLGVGQRDDHRQLAVGGQAVAFVGTRVFRVGQHAAFGQGGAQGGGDLLPAHGIDGDGL